ncbi:MAG: STAS domain-containing protein [Nitrospiraceae bacterium]|nr:STAS domain-containing protein [Nitrospiraceae bacterium]
MFEYRFEDLNHATVLSLSGELTLDEAISDLRNVLLEKLSHADNIVINLDGIKAIDLSVLQLFCSAHRMALTSGKSLSLSSYPTLFMKAVRNVGLSSLVCRNDIWRAECLWPELSMLPGEN